MALRLDNGSSGFVLPWQDGDVAFLDVCSCLRMDAEVAEGGGERDVFEVESADHSVGQIVLADDDVDAFFGGIEFEGAQAEELDDFFDGGVVEFDFRKLDRELG